MDTQEQAEQLQTILAELENRKSVAFEFEIGEKIFALLAKDEVFKEDLPWRAEAMAFQFRESSRMDGEDSDFHYLPLSSFTTKDGVIHEQPDSADVTKEIVDYWLQRATRTHNPLLKARYSGLAWEFGKKRLHIPIELGIAITHIDSLLTIANDGLCTEPVGTIDKLLRALSLACALDNDVLIAKCKKALIDYEDRVGDDHHAGLWGNAFDALMQNKKVNLTELEKNHLLTGLEDRLKRLADSSGGALPDHWSAEQAASRLADYYRSVNDLENMRRIISVLGNAWNVAVSKADALLASAWLEHLQAIYESYGLRKEADDALKSMRALSLEALKLMKPIEHHVQVSKEAFDAFLAKMIEGGLEKALLRITARFIPKQKNVKEILQKSASLAPLSSMLQKRLMDQDGTVTSTIGSTSDDINGNVANQTAQLIQFESGVLADVFAQLRDTYTIGTDTIVRWLYQSPAFKEDRRAIIEKGLDAYFREDYLASIHILIPQIEEVIRHLLELCGGSVLKKNRLGGYDLRTLDDLLRDHQIVTSLGEDMAIYLRILLTDRRGWNLRNELSHGILPFDAANRPVADRVIHSFLCLAMIRKEEHQVEDGPGGTG